MPTMSQLVFDEKLVAQLEELYATRDVLRRRRLVREALGVKAGERILDVGCGPGFYVAELLDEVGPNGSIVGLDASATMLAVAAKRSEGKPNVAFHEADATALPVGDGEFDAALCVQVLEYVPDATAALHELHRALRPGGRVLVWDVDWATVSWHSSDPARMERVLEAWDAHLAHPSLPRTLGPRMRAAGFEEVEAEGHTFATAELTADAYGAAAIPVVEKYVAGHEAIGPDEAAAWAAEQRELGQRGEFYFACVQLCFTGSRPG
jgi:arsenite methyltransferase